MEAVDQLKAIHYTFWAGEGPRADFELTLNPGGSLTFAPECFGFVCEHGSVVALPKPPDG
jgi:hypothetical protein